MSHIPDQPACKHQSICHLLHRLGQEFHLKLLCAFSVYLILAAVDGFDGTHLRMDVLHSGGCLSDIAHNLIQNIAAFHERFCLMVTLLFLKRIDPLIRPVDQEKLQLSQNIQFQSGIFPENLVGFGQYVVQSKRSSYSLFCQKAADKIQAPLVERIQECRFVFGHNIQIG